MWNVVNAAPILRTPTPEQRRKLDAEGCSLRLAQPLSLYEVRRRGAGGQAGPEAPHTHAALSVRPPGAGKPFCPVRNPYLARSAKGLSAFVRILVESEPRLRLSGLWIASQPPPDRGGSSLGVTDTASARTPRLGVLVVAAELDAHLPADLDPVGLGLAGAAVAPDGDAVMHAQRALRGLDSLLRPGEDLL